MRLERELLETGQYATRAVYTCSSKATESWKAGDSDAAQCRSSCFLRMMRVMIGPMLVMVLVAAIDQ